MLANDAAHGTQLVFNWLGHQPLDVLRSILTVHNGKATTAAIRNALMQIGIEGSAWSAWWRKTRKLAEASPEYRVTGTQARGDVQLLLTQTDPVEDAKARWEGEMHMSDG